MLSFANIRQYTLLSEVNIVFLDVLLVGVVISQGFKDLERLQMNAK